MSLNLKITHTPVYQQPNGIAEIPLYVRFKSYSVLLSGLVMFVAFLVLIGWQLDINFFKRPVPNLVAMNPMTAICFILSAGSLWFLRNSQQTTAIKIGASILATSTFIIGTLKLISLGGYIPYKLDTLLFSQKVAADVVGNVSNTMAPNTAFGFALLGLALFLCQFKNAIVLKLVNYIALLVFITGLFSSIGYLYNVKEFYGILSYIPMAVHTALCFVCISLAVLFVNSGYGFMQTFTSRRLGGTIARLLVPTTIILPIVLGYTQLIFNHSHTITVELGVSLLITSVIVVFFSIVWYVSVELNALDKARTKAESEILLLNKDLEQKIVARTEEVVAKEKRYRALIENSADAIVMIGETGELIYQSPAFERITGFSTEDITGLTWEQLIHPDDIKESLMFSEHLKAVQGLPQQKSLRVRHKDGTYIWIEGTLTNLTNNTYVNAVIANFRNINDRKKNEAEIQQLNTELELRVERRTAQLEAANKELEAFSYSVSHDLRAPLRGVYGYTQMLTEDYGPKLDGEAKRLMNNIMSNAKKMGTLIDDLLAFSRLGRKELVKMNIPMREMVRNIADELIAAENGRDIEIKINEIPDVLADSATMKQVWINLISNSLKYSKPKVKTVIEIGATNNAETVTYYIKDNGVGFDMRFADKLFGVFQRLHSHNDFDGTGVGLAIVQRVISRHGGKVWADAKVNEGASFYFSLNKN